MADHEEEAQVEALKKWWKENWKALVAGLVIGVGGIGGWEAWKDYRTTQAGDASRMYEELSDALEADSADKADQLAAELKVRHADSPYAAHGALAMAGYLFDRGDLAAADERLNWVVTRTGDQGLRMIARLRRARVQWAQGNVTDALNMLTVEDAGAFQSLFAELKGDILLASGDRKKAQAQYTLAMAALPDGAANRQLLQRKLDDLAGVAES